MGTSSEEQSSQESPCEQSSLAQISVSTPAAGQASTTTRQDLWFAVAAPDANIGQIEALQHLLQLLGL